MLLVFCNRPTTSAFVSALSWLRSLFNHLSLRGRGFGHFLLALALLAAFSLPAQAAGGSFGGGNGTAATPYLLEDAADLNAVRNDLTAHYKLSNDIDLAAYLASGGAGYHGGAGWNPIGSGAPSGNDASRFTGSFDGDSYVIENLSINRAAQDEIGLFGAVGTNGVVKNLGIVGGEVRGATSVGAMVGYLYGGTIENSYADVDVVGTGAQIGGLVGRQSSTGNVTTLIANSYASGNVSGGNRVGGLVGQQDRYGALFNFEGNRIRFSYAMGSVTGNDHVGGLVGAQIIGVVETGTNASGNNHIDNCYATGSVAGNNYVGGLTGLQHRAGSAVNSRNNITYSYAAGHVSAVVSDRVGGLVGAQWTNGTAVTNTITSSYFDKDATGHTVGIGVGSQAGVTGLTTEQMTDDDTLDPGGAMAAFDNTVWSKRTAGSGYLHYPELTVFYGDGLLDTVWKTASELSVRVMMGEAPTIISANSTTVTYGTGGTFQVTATGDPAASFSLEGAVPTGVSINSTSGIITITATTAVGNHAFTIRATNGIAPDATQLFTLTVNPFSGGTPSAIPALNPAMLVLLALALALAGLMGRQRRRV